MLVRAEDGVPPIQKSFPAALFNAGSEASSTGEPQAPQDGEKKSAFLRLR